MKSNNVLSVAFLIITTLETLEAAPSSLISYQGKLADGANSVSGTAHMIFKIFDSPTNGTCLYEEAQTVFTTNGLFSTLIGQAPVSGTLDDASRADEAYLEIAVEGVPLLPRQRFLAPPFAKRSSERWNLFGWGYCNPPCSCAPFYYLTPSAREIFDDVSIKPTEGNPPLLVLFPPSAESVILTSVSVLVFRQSLTYPPGASHDDNVQAQISLKACTLDGSPRYIGKPTLFSLTNLMVPTWLTITLPTNTAPKTLQSNELFQLEFGAVGSNPTNGV